MAREAFYYQQFKSKTAAGGRGKWLKSFSKSTPRCGLGAAASPWPVIGHSHSLGNHCTPESQRGTGGDERG